MADTEQMSAINDVVYDSRGKHVAVCSNDMSVEVWEQAERVTEWIRSCSWKAHSASIRRAAWAPIKYGTVLATCSNDGTVAVWQEKIMDTQEELKRWTLKTYFHDSCTPITDIKFAPEDFGLILATCSTDGIIRFYEALDERNADAWIMQLDMAYKLSWSCLSWTMSITRRHSAFLAAGSDDTDGPNEGKIVILQYIERLFRWETATTIPEVTNAVHDVAFANTFGRRYYVLAVATNNVQLYHISPLKLDISELSTLSRFSIELCAQFDVHHCTMLRVGWNLPSTLLSSLGTDGIVHIWECSSYFEINDSMKWDLTQEKEGGESSVQSCLPCKALSSPLGVMATSILTSDDL